MSLTPSPRRILVLDAAPAQVRARVAAVFHDGADFSLLSDMTASGHEGIGDMAGMAARCLRAAGWENPDLVTVIVGPGSFTGLRTSCSLAAGLAFGAGCPVVGVTRGEALAARMTLAARTLGLDGWLHVTAARRGRWFVETAAPDATRHGTVAAVQSASWQPPEGNWLLAGDVVEDVAAIAPSRLFQADFAGEAGPWEIARAGSLRLAGACAPRTALPLYVDPPEAKLPAGGLRARPE